MPISGQIQVDYSALSISYTEVGYPGAVVQVTGAVTSSTNPIVKWTYSGGGFSPNPLVVFDALPQAYTCGPVTSPGCESVTCLLEDSLGNTQLIQGLVRIQPYEVFTGSVPNQFGEVVEFGKSSDAGVCNNSLDGFFAPDYGNPFSWSFSGATCVTTATVVPGGMYLETTTTMTLPMDPDGYWATGAATFSADAVPPWVSPTTVGPLVTAAISSTATSFTPSGPPPFGDAWTNDSALAPGDVVVTSATIPTVEEVHVLLTAMFSAFDSPPEDAFAGQVVAGVLIPPFQSVLTPTCLPGATLGVGEDIQVLLMTRGGGSVIAELNPVSGSFTRDVDATSTLEMTGVTSGLLGESCCDNWEEVYPWNTEIIVYRDGRDAWCGPVTGVEFGYGTVKVTAADLTAWWDRRVLPADLNFVNVDLATIFESVVTSAMSTDPVANFSITTTPTGILGSRTYLQTDYKYASDLLSELAKTGIDYSAYGRTILCGGEQVPADPYVVLTDEFWVQPPTISARGNDQATQVIVLGKGVTGIATATTPYTDFYGLLVRTFSETEIEDVASAQAAANTRLALLQDQLYIDSGSGGGLKPTAPITLPELIPGIRVRVDSSASCRQVVADFRLKSVKVGFDGSVSIDLQPLGTVGT